MTIFNDTFGNFYIGSYIAGNSLDWNEVVTCFRLALGSSERVNFKSDNLSALRIDWRPNLVEETLTGEIPVPLQDRLSDGFAGYELSNNSRISLAYTKQNTYANSLFKTGVANLFFLASSHPFIQLTNNDNFWMVANNRSISFFIYRNNSVSYFFSQGFLLNSNLLFPENSYALYNSRNTSNYNFECHAKGFAGSLLKTLHTFGDKANYTHTKLSNNEVTTSEVELYLRDANTDIPYGYVPNIFKWKLDGNEIVPNIGDTVRLNLNNAIGYYEGQGNIFCKVVGQLGNTSNTVTDTGRDYILMRIYG